MKIHRNYSLTSKNTLKLQASCRYLIELESRDDVSALFTIQEFDIENFFVLGEGSNVILPKNYEGSVLKALFYGFELTRSQENYLQLKVGAGESWAGLIDYCLDNNLMGLENLTLIPGSVGASPIQNIGAYGVEVCDSIESVEVFNFEVKEFQILTKEQCLFSYRNSIFKINPNKYLILFVNFCFKENASLNNDYHSLKQKLAKEGIAEENLTARIISKTIASIRQERLPNPDLEPNAGSFFKNPIVNQDHFDTLKEKFPNIVSFDQEGDYKKLSAAWLIENADWKGRKEGDLKVSGLHALVIVNKGQATQKDLLSFAKNIQKDVFNLFKVNLEIEPLLKP